MKEMKSTKDLWDKTKTIGIVVNAMVGTIGLVEAQTQVLEKVISGVEHYYTWAILIGRVVASIII